MVGCCVQVDCCPTAYPTLTPCCQLLSHASSAVHQLMPIFELHVCAVWLQPDNEVTCCRQYTIRLDVTDFQPSKAHRKLLRKWEQYLAGGG